MFVQYSGSTKLLLHSMVLFWSFRDVASFVVRRKVVDRTSKWVSACVVWLSSLPMYLLTAIVLLIIYCSHQCVSSFYYHHHTTTCPDAKIALFLICFDHIMVRRCCCHRHAHTKSHQWFRSFCIQAKLRSHIIMCYNDGASIPLTVALQSGDKSPTKCMVW